MPIAKIQGGSLTQRCQACDARRDLALVDLVLGTPDEADAITLPACACGAQETLFRTHAPACAGAKGSPRERHREGVNALARRLASRVPDFDLILEPDPKDPSCR